MIKILKKAMRNPEFDEPGFAWIIIACYLSLTGRTDCCCRLFSVFFFLSDGSGFCHKICLILFIVQ